MANLVPNRKATRLLRITVKEMKTIVGETFEWTVPQWAKRAGVSDQTAYNLLRGKTRFPRWETIVKMANACELDLITADKGVAELRVKSHVLETIGVS